MTDISIEVIFDNYPAKPGLQTSGGFACLVRTGDHNVLFDTGREADIFVSNMKKLGIDPGTIDLAVLSHDHDDHTGGLGALLGLNPDIDVYLPRSFPRAIKDLVVSRGARLTEVGEPVKIREGVYSTGEMGTGIIEQSLALTTDKGIILITGCAHPGILPIIEKVKKPHAGEILLAMGGFHLRAERVERLREIVSSLMDLGVQYLGPCHCSGDQIRGLLREEYGRHYHEIGVGTSISNLAR